MGGKLSEVKKIVKKHWYIIKWMTIFCMLLAFLFGMYMCYLKDRIPEYVTHVGNKNEEQVIHDLTSEYTIEQKFSSPREFDFITLDFSDHDQTIEGKTGILVYDEEGTLLIYKEMDNAEIHYGQPVGISFQEVGGGAADREYLLEIHEADTGEIALGIFGYQISSEEYAAKVNGTLQNYAVSVGTHSYTNYFWGLVWIIIIICTAGTIAVIAISARKSISEEKLFLAIAIPFSAGMLFLSTVNGVYDGGHHLAAVYQNSNMLLGKGELNSADGTYIRKQDMETFLKNKSAEVENEQAQESWRVWKDWKWLDPGEEMVINDQFVPSMGGTMLAYLPNTLGFTLGRILGLGTYPAIFLAKLSGCIVYLLICYLAIRKTPLLKTVFAFTAALPVSLYNAAGITYDTMAIASVLLMCAYIFVWWQRNLTKKECAVLATAVIFVASCKGGVYLPAILLLLAVPTKRFHINKKKVLILFTGLLLVTAFFAIRYGSIVKALLQDSTGIKYGAGYCFVHPFEFCRMLLLSIIERGDIYLGQLLGYRAAWMNSVIAWMVMIPFLLLLMCAGVQAAHEDQIDRRKRVFLWTLLLVEFVGMHVILLSDTDVGSEYIYGVQGRYFVAYLPFVILAFRNNQIYRKKECGNGRYILFSMAQYVYMFAFLDGFFNA